MNDWQDKRGPRGPRRPNDRGGSRGGELPRAPREKRLGQEGSAPRSRDDRPKSERPYGDRPQGDRPSGDRDGGYQKRGFGEKRFGEKRFGEKRFGERDVADRPFKSRAGFGERPLRGGQDDRPPRRNDGDSPRGRPFADKPYRDRSAGGKSFGAKRSYGERSFDDRGDRPRRPERPVVPRRGDPERLARADKDGLERIAKVIARAGIASRRDAEVLIEEGRVQVNGETIASPALDVSPDADIRVDGEKLPSRERTRLWLFHKPSGLVSTTRDPEGRPTVFEALPEDLPRVMSVGRLDINTEGLLLFTNDGGLARVLSHPETGWLRRYRVRAYGHVDMSRLEELKHGVTIDGEEYGPIIATVDREQGDNTWLTLDLREGRNREVKNVLEHVGLMVNRLIRVSFGPFQLGEMKEGEVEEVRTKVLQEQLGEQLARIAECEFDGPVRTPAGPAGREKDNERTPRRDFGDRPRRDFGDRPSRPRTEQHAPEEERPDLLLRKRGGRGEIWRDEDTKGMKPRRAGPRRGEDPREDRARRDQSNEALGRERTRAKPVEDASGRRVTVERVTGPSPEITRKPRYTRDDFRDRPRRDEDGDRPPRRPRGDFGDRPPRKDFAPRQDGERPFRKRFDDDRPARRPRQDGERPRRFDDAERPRRFEDGDRPRKPRGEFGDRPPRRDGGDRPPRRDLSERPARKDFSDRPPRREFGDRPPRQDGERRARKRFDDDQPARPRFERDGERRGPPRSRPPGDRPFGDKPRGPRKPR